MQVWAIRQWVGSLTSERTPECPFFFFFFFKLSLLHLYFTGFRGFRSIVATLLISAQQKKRAITAIIVAAACFLVEQWQLHLQPGSAVEGLTEGRCSESRACSDEERTGKVTAASSVSRIERNTQSEKVLCFFSVETAGSPACKSGPWEQ